MKKRLISATAAACIALAGFALPASAEVPITLNAGAGYWFFDHEVFDLEPDDDVTPVVGIEYALNDNWAAELMFADSDTKFKDTNVDVDVTTWQLGMRYYPGSGDRRFLPYVAFGAGEIDFDADRFDSVETTVNGGLGLRYMFGDRIGVSVETRAIHSLDEGDTDLLVTAGLNFWLGAVNDGTSDVVAVADTMMVDTDGDGIADDADRCLDTAPGVRVDADGCDLPVVQVASVKLMVNFGVDSTQVQEQYFSDLSELAEFLNRFQDLEVDVEGHTDNTGAESYNQDLSQRRAQAVVDMLVSEHGISRDRLQAKGYGESSPVASNDTDDGRAQNRRVMATLEIEYGG
ncbi:MAG: OOP family OmpA-OmpF porin [Bacteroidia bacterium]|jgi:OOP family OmpA-OmpF porin